MKNIKIYNEVLNTTDYRDKTGNVYCMSCDKEYGILNVWTRMEINKYLCVFCQTRWEHLFFDYRNTMCNILTRAGTRICIKKN